MRRLRRAKIVATLGPASSDREMIARLFAAGVDVFRINMSHTSHERMRELVAAIRGVEERQRPADRHPGRSAGPEAAARHFHRRRGDGEEGRHIHARFQDPAPGDATRAFLPHPEIFAAVEPGHTLLIDDGKVRLTVIAAEPKRMETRIDVAGKLSDRKGVSVPDLTISFSALAEKTAPTSKPPSIPASTGWHCLSSSGRKTSPRRRKSPAAALW